jgi:hypothetical protein
MGNYGEILYKPPYKWMNIKVTIGNQWNNMDKSSIILDEHGDFNRNIMREKNKKEHIWKHPLATTLHG